MYNTQQWHQSQCLQGFQVLSSHNCETRANNDYNEITNRLRYINNKLGLLVSDYIFTKELFVVDLPERLDWLQTVFDMKKIKISFNITDLAKIQRCIDFFIAKKVKYDRC